MPCDADGSRCSVRLWGWQLIVLFFLSSTWAGADSQPFEKWKFHYGDDPAWAQPDFNDDDWHEPQVPGLPLIYQNLGKRGFFGWYRVGFRLPETDAPPAVWGISLGEMNTIEELYLNGVRIGGTGVFGSSIWQLFYVRQKSRVYQLPEAVLKPHSQMNTLAIRIQDDGFGASGIVKGPVILGDYISLLEQTQRGQWGRSVGNVTMLLLGAILFLVWIPLWLGGQRDVEQLLFGVMLILYLFWFFTDSVGPQFGWVTPWLQEWGRIAVCLLSIVVILYALTYLGMPTRTRTVYLFTCFMVIQAVGPHIGMNWFWRLAAFYSYLITSIAILIYVGVQAVRAARQGVPGAWIILCALGWIILTFALTMSPKINAEWAPALYTVHGFLLLLVIAFGQRYMQLQRDVQTLSSRLIDAQETERRRVARDLHDGLGQRLLANRVTLQMAQAQDPDPTVEEIIDDLGETAEELRGVVRDLRPVFLETLGLSRALMGYCQRLQEAHEVDIIAVVEVPSPLTRQAEEHLFRIGQEALQNALQHADATRIALSCHATSKELVLDIRDNGRGMSRQDRHQSRGLGLVTMRERARLLGAQFIFNSQPGHGTHLAIRLTRYIHRGSDQVAV